MAHVDLLHPARRMWREEGECRLTYSSIRCAGTRAQGRSGFEIPSRI
jgi:hypothetical protein